MRLGLSHPLVCQRFVALITDYFDDALPRGERRRFERHLAACEGCAAYLEQFRATVDSLGELPPEPADEHVREHLLAAFRELRA